MLCIICFSNENIVTDGLSAFRELLTPLDTTHYRRTLARENRQHMFAPGLLLRASIAAFKEDWQVRGDVALVVVDLLP